MNVWGENFSQGARMDVDADFSRLCEGSVGIITYSMDYDDPTDQVSPDSLQLSTIWDLSC